MSPKEGSPEWAAQDKGPQILAICWTVTAISTLFVAARLYVRGIMQKQLRLDDYFIIVSIICGYISTALSTVAVSYGDGKHFSTLSVHQQENAILFVTAGFCPGVMSFGIPKLAVISLLTQLLNPGKFHLWFLWGMGIIAQLTLFATVGVLLGQCTPARALWNFELMATATCFDKTILVDYCIYAGSFSAFVDIYLAIYPTIVLFKLQLSLKKKLALSAALGVGAVSGVVAIYKTTRIPSLASPDFSYDTSDLTIWTVIEGSAIIIASSIPLLQPLMEWVFGRNIFTSGKGTKNRRYYEDYSEQSGHMASAHGGMKDSRISKKKPGLYDDLELTVRDRTASEEEILDPRQKRMVIETSQEIKHGNNMPQAITSPQAITRTDHVTVSYGPPGMKAPPTTPRWNGV